MPDWKKHVREHLPPLQLGAERELEIVEEFAQHLEAIYEDALAKGFSEQEAYRRAVAQINDWQLLECEVSRAERPSAWLNQPTGDRMYREKGRINMGFLQDLRYGVRMLLKNKGFALIAVFSLALGIGANTAIFSLIDVVLLKMLPVERPEQLYFIQHVGARREGGGAPPYPCFERFRERTQFFTGLAAFTSQSPKVSIDGQIEQVSGQFVSGNYFSLLGVKAMLGRTLSPEDDSTPGKGGPDGFVAVISYNYWTHRFGRNPAVVGKVVTIGNDPVTIIGVTPPDFYGLFPGKEVNISLPIMIEGAEMLTEKESWWFQAVGRLKPGSSVEQARAELDAILQPYMDETTISAEMRRDAFARIELAPASKGLDTLRRQFSRPLQALMVIVALVLLIACANVANLLMARGASRRKEFAVRLAMGASRARLIRQMLTESLLLVGLSGLLGLLIARWGGYFLVSFFAAGPRRLFIDLPLDGRVLLFTFGISLFTALIFGLAPAIQATRVDLNPALKDCAGTLTDSFSRIRVGKLLIVLQVAVSLLLLVGAGLFVRTLQNLNHLDAGFNRDGVLIMNINPLETIYQGPRRTALWKDILRRAETLPGVRAASLSTLSPLDGSDRGVGVEVSGYNPNTERDKHIRLNQVSPGYFRVMGIALLQGRDFTERDNETGPKAALLNETAARFYFGNQSPLGAQVRFLRGPGRPPTEPYEIVGVVKDSRDLNLRDEVERLIYLPTLQARDGLGRLTLAVRADGKPADLAGALRNEINAAGSDILVANVSTLSEQVNQTLIQERLVAALSIGFGLLALLLACIGLYGVMSYSAARRTHEIGIRIALGAQRWDVVRLMMRESMLLVAFGVVIGLAASLATTRLVSGLLFGLTPNDPLTILIAILLMIAMAMIAGYLPARRASRVDPMIALRYE